MPRVVKKRIVTDEENDTPPVVMRKSSSPFNFNSPTPLMSLGFLVIGLLLGGLLGSLFTKVQYLEKGNTVLGAAVPSGTAPSGVPQAAPTQDISPKEVALDGDALLGNTNAPVTLVEFSDYECPFCKRYFTLPVST